ncbi:S8 family peptidase [Chryseobacterium populi]|uniref:Por secretion system C-terminal sorting domain containing protein n=1 Tax=Chryseobacterium populi TaxID=1144316 RepID=J2SW80_9FLAO|nr:S8 family peptidase [Chryseobacterium populi]EJL69872.1 Por secretion system C-terminal sorting domain containing protein [Chryseobacterium populi]
MKKHLFLAGLLTATFVAAQKNSALMRDFEKQNNESNQKFDVYITKNYGSGKDLKTGKEIEDKRANLAGFLGNIPYFYEAHNIDQIKNSNSDFLQNGTIAGLNGSFNGENIKFTIFDGGRVYAAHNVFNNATGRITNKEATTMNYSAHATAVSSFIGGKAYTSSGKNIQGIAKNSTIESYAFMKSILPGDPSESIVFQKILKAQPKISNHSYGTNMGWDYRPINGSYTWIWTGYYSNGTSYDLQGTYYQNDKNYDQIVYSNPSYIIVKSAGNSYGMLPSAFVTKYYQDSTGKLVKFSFSDPLPPKNCKDGYDCIGTGSLAKNIIVVGASDIITTNGGRYSNASSVVHSSYSSAGPRDDGGIKPDITTVGTNVGHASTAENTTGSTTYGTGNGTSYSGPVVTGIIGLWTQINKQLFNGSEFNAASAKVLTIHSASEAGTVGPDPHHGWGFINAKKGAELLVGKSNGTVIFTDETLNSGTANNKTITASGNEPLKVTISWIDPAYNHPDYQTFQEAHNIRTSNLVNDLDLRIIDITNNTVYYPWKLNVSSPMTTATKADNKVDNVEQVVIDAPTAGRSYRIEVSNKGTLVNDSGASAPQNYSIMVTGHSNQQITSPKAATNEKSLISNISIAPTVTKNTVNILNAPEKSTFNLYDLSGKKLHNGTFSRKTETVDLSSYPNAIYIIEIITGKETISKRVIKE